MIEYKPTKDNAAEIAERMCQALAEKVISVVKDRYGMKCRENQSGLDNGGWVGESKSQELPVKVSDIQLMWSTGSVLYSLGCDKNVTISFPAPGVVVVKQKSASGNDLIWTFVGEGE